MWAVVRRIATETGAVELRDRLRELVAS